MKTLVPIILLALAASVLTSSAQQPTPPLMIVQAAGTTTAAAPSAPTTPAGEDNSVALQTAIKLLEQTKAANIEMLKKQEDMLTLLDDVQKAADQLRIFAHRSGG